MEWLLVLVGVVYLVLPWVALVIALDGRRMAREVADRLSDALEQLQGRPMRRVPSRQPEAVLTPHVESPISVAREVVEHPSEIIEEAATTAEARDEERAELRDEAKLESARVEERVAQVEQEIDEEPEDVVERAAPVPIEERLVRIGIWIAGIALALSGVYLVKWSFDRNLLTEPVRVGMGSGFGLLLVGLSEWFGRRQAMKRIDEALAAAGVAVLFASLTAAVRLYHLIDPMVGFGLLALVTGGAVVLSLRRGPFVALLGLVGGFLTPALVGATEADASELFGYLILLQVGLITVTRRRGWWWLTLATLLSGYAWVAIWAALYYDAASSGWAGLFVLASVAAFTAGSLNVRDRLGKFGVAEVVSWASVTIGLLLTAVLVKAGGFRAWDWAYIVVLGAGCMALGRLRWRFEPLAWLAATACAAMLLVWHADDGNDALFRAVALLFGVLYAGGAYGCMWGSIQPARWAKMSGIAATAFMLIAYMSLGDGGVALPWWTISAGLGAAYIGAAAVVYLRREAFGKGQGEAAVGALSVTAAALLVIASPMGLDDQWTMIAWAAMLPVMAVVDWRFRIRALRIAAWVAGALVMVGLTLNPNVLDWPGGQRIVFNTLLYGYGVPIACMGGAAWLYHRIDRSMTLVAAMQVGAAVLGFVMATLMIRHGFHPDPGTLGTATIGLREWGTYHLMCLAFSAGLLALARRIDSGVLRQLATGAALGAMGLGAVLMVIVQNPLLTRDPVGETVVFNWLMYLYGLPIVLGGWLAWWFVKRNERTWAAMSMAYAVLFMFMLVTLQVRQGFAGPVLGEAAVTLTEAATYGVMWLIVGGVLTAAGRLLGETAMQTAGLVIAVMGLAAAVLGPCLAANPLWRAHEIAGVTLLNMLLYDYGLPAMLALGLYGLLIGGERTRPVAIAAGLTSLVMLFMLVTLQVRHGFQGASLLIEGSNTTAMEKYAYSAAWLSFGATLLVLGIVTRSSVLRFASLGVMILVVGKVFIYDTSELRDLYRVGSFLGLGVSLLVLAYLYQRFVFGARMAGSE